MLTTLHHLRVLVTRPEPQATSLSKAIASLDCTPITLPLVNFVAHDPGLSLNLDEVSTIIAISPRAVTYGLPWLLHHSHLNEKELSDLAISWFALGPQTAKDLQNVDIHVTNNPQEGLNSEALLNHPKLNQRLKNSRICLILKGVGGRDALKKTLCQLGISVHEASVYKRVLPLYTKQKLASAFATAPDCLTVTSGEILDQLTILLKDHCAQPWQDIPLIVVGLRQKKLATAHGYKCIYVAEAADNESIISILKDLILQKAPSQKIAE